MKMVRRGLTSAGAVEMDVEIYQEVVPSGYQMAPCEKRRSQLASLVRNDGRCRYCLCFALSWFMVMVSVSVFLS